MRDRWEAQKAPGAVVRREFMAGASARRVGGGGGESMDMAAGRSKSQGVKVGIQGEAQRQINGRDSDQEWAEGGRSSAVARAAERGGQCGRGRQGQLTGQAQG